MSQSPAEDAPGHPVESTVSTGDGRVDQALAATASLDDVDVAEHPAAYEHVHRVLRDSLAGTPSAADEGLRE